LFQMVRILAQAQALPKSYRMEGECVSRRLRAAPGQAPALGRGGLSFSCL